MSTLGIVEIECSSQDVDEIVASLGRVIVTGSWLHIENLNCPSELNAGCCGKRGEFLGGVEQLSEFLGEGNGSGDLFLRLVFGLHVILLLLSQTAEAQLG